MQNKPNLLDAQMNVSNVKTMNYKNLSRWRDKKTNPNKAKTNPISSNAKMNINLLITKDYIKKDDFAVRKNKPKTNPIQTQSKPILKGMNLTFVPHGIMRVNPHSQQIIQSSISPLPGIVGRAQAHQGWAGRKSSRQADKIALKIYPFGIDCPIVCEERLFAIYRKDYD